MYDVIDPLPLGANPKYDLNKNDMVFYLTSDRNLSFYNGGEPFLHIDCPLLHLSLDELIKIREQVKKSVITGKLYASCIADGGDERGRGIYFVATRGTVIEYK